MNAEQRAQARADAEVINRLVRETLEVYRDQTVDTILLSLGEVMARILVETNCHPEATLTCLHLIARRWIDSGLLTPWHRQELPLQ